MIQCQLTVIPSIGHFVQQESVIVFLFWKVKVAQIKDACACVCFLTNGQEWYSLQKLTKMIGLLPPKVRRKTHTNMPDRCLKRKKAENVCEVLAVSPAKNEAPSLAMSYRTLRPSSKTINNTNVILGLNCVLFSFFWS